MYSEILLLRASVAIEYTMHHNTMLTFIVLHTHPDHQAYLQRHVIFPLLKLCRILGNTRGMTSPLKIPLPPSGFFFGHACGRDGDFIFLFQLFPHSLGTCFCFSFPALPPSVCRRIRGGIERQKVVGGWFGGCHWRPGKGSSSSSSAAASP